MLAKHGHFERRRAILNVRRWARLCGKHDANNELGKIGTAALRDARARAREEGCVLEDIDDETFVGLELGRQDARDGREDEGTR